MYNDHTIMVLQQQLRMRQQSASLLEKWIAEAQEKGQPYKVKVYADRLYHARIVMEALESAIGALQTLEITNASNQSLGQDQPRNRP